MNAKQRKVSRQDPHQPETPDFRKLQSPRRWFRELKWGDYLLYGVIIIAAVLSFRLTSISQEQATIAVLTQDGEPILRVSEEEMLAAGNVELSSRSFHYIIEYEEGRVRFAQADCPDQICVHTGWISHSGQLSACVPGYLVLRLESEQPEARDADDLDVVIR